MDISRSMRTLYTLMHFYDTDLILICLATFYVHCLQKGVDTVATCDS